MKSLVAALVVVAAVRLDGAEHKRPWEYTDAERLAVRFDPQSIRARWFHHAEESGDVRTNAMPDAIDNVIVGRDNPELFLPFELFQNLVSRGIITRDDDNWRSRFDERLRPLIEPSHFWAAVETSSAEYIEILRHENAITRQIRSDYRPPEAAALQSESAQRAQCAARAAALEASTNALGKAILHRALYELIAPTMASFSPPERDATQVEWVAGGCR